MSKDFFIYNFRFGISKVDIGRKSTKRQYLYPFEAWASPQGALFAGSPAEIVEKILWEHEILGHTRFLAQVGLGGLSQTQTLRSIELLAAEVLSAVRAALKQKGHRTITG